MTDLPILTDPTTPEEQALPDTHGWPRECLWFEWQPDYQALELADKLRQDPITVEPPEWPKRDSLSGTASDTHGIPKDAA